MQSKRMSMIESVSGLAAGFWLSWFTNVAILPLIGVHMSHGQAWKSVVIFSVLSLARQYVMRRLFVRIGREGSDGEKTKAQRGCRRNLTGVSWPAADRRTSSEVYDGSGQGAA